jgi:hypothetical protein
MLIPLNQLHQNKLNANVMTDEAFKKLKANIQRQKGKYPSLIVRKIGVPPTDFDKKNTVGELKGYRIIDGQYRKQALEELNYEKAECEVWDIDDKTEMLLLATLNELKGTPDLTKRAILLHTLEIIGIARENLLKLIPEDNRRLDFVLSLVEKRKDLEGITDEVQLRNIAIEKERDMLREKFIQEGIDPKTAEAMADIYAFKKYVPVPKTPLKGKKINVRLFLIFFFDNEKDFKLACDFFEAGEKGEKEPNTKKLLELIKKYESNLS